jgi:hypothetical protein
MLGKKLFDRTATWPCEAHDIKISLRAQNWEQECYTTVERLSTSDTSQEADISQILANLCAVLTPLNGRLFHPMLDSRHYCAHKAQISHSVSSCAKGRITRIAAQITGGSRDVRTVFT